MPRPFVYKHLDKTLISGDLRETIALGFGSMYAVKKGNDWVTICRQDAFGLKPSEGRKYQRLFFATEQTAKRHASKLNKIYNSTEYTVVKI